MKIADLLNEETADSVEKLSRDLAKKHNAEFKQMTAAERTTYFTKMLKRCDALRQALNDSTKDKNGKRIDSRISDVVYKHEQVDGMRSGLELAVRKFKVKINYDWHQNTPSNIR